MLAFLILTYSHSSFPCFDTHHFLTLIIAHSLSVGVSCVTCPSLFNHNRLFFSLMLPITSIASVSLLEALRGGAARAPPPPPPPSSSVGQLYANFFKLPEAFRFFISGNFGNVIFFALERMCHAFLTANLDKMPSMVVDYKDGVSFLSAYIMQVATQHLLHAYLVYGLHTISTREKYIKTLIGCYST